MLLKTLEKVGKELRPHIGEPTEGALFHFQVPAIFRNRKKKTYIYQTP